MSSTLARNYVQRHPVFYQEKEKIMELKDEENRDKPPTIIGKKKDQLTRLSYNTLGDQRLHLNSDKQPLIVHSDASYEKSNSKKPKVIGKTENHNSVGFFKLFRFAGCLDILFMLLGTLGAVLLGMALPFNLIVYGSVVDAVLYHVLKDVNESLAFETYSEVFNNHTTLYEDVRVNIPYFCYIAVSAFVGGFMQMTFWMLAAERQVHHMRMKLFQSIITKQISWFDQAKTGDIMIKLSDDLQIIEAGISSKLACFIQWNSTFVTGFLLGFLNGWKLSLVILASSPMIIMAGGAAAYILRWVSENEQQAYGEAGAVAEEVLAAVRTVTAFSGQEKEVSRYAQHLQKAKSAGIEKSLLSGLGVGFVWINLLGMFGLSLWYGTKLVASGEYTGGNVVQVFFACVVGGFQLGNSLPLLQYFSHARGCAGKIYQILDQKSDIDPLSTEGEKPEKLQGNISFRKVCFSYPSRPECQVLNHLSFDVHVGQTVAIVGPSGCGKSTIVRLLQRFYDIQSGEITLDGHDIRDLNVQWMRERVGVVSQDPVLFNTTVRENIGYGREDASFRDIVQAAVISNAHSFIEELPAKYETVVGQQGTHLSGGQKQRVAIARAVVRNPCILLLDEATSALDTQNEALVKIALDKACQGRTTIIVAHRLSTIKNADVILVIRKGQVEESGSHEELMEKHGLYYSLVHKQNKSIEKEKKGLIVEKNMLDVDKDEKPLDGSLLKDYREALHVERTDMNKTEHAEEQKALLPVSSLRRVLHLYAPQWPFILFGSLMAILSGAILPAFALVISEFMNNFGTIDAAYQFRRAGILAGVIVAVAVTCGIAFVIQNYLFGIAGENLTLKMRKLAFASMLKQEMGWFDDPKNSVGLLTAQLATDASMIRGVVIDQLSTTVQILSTLLIALSVAFTFSWKLAFVVVAFFPFIIFSHLFQSKMYHSVGKKNKEADEEGAKIALEAIQNIRTVASLGRERIYKEKYEKFHNRIIKRGRASALVYGLTQGFSQCVVFFCYAATFAYGSYLIDRQELTFVDMIRVFLSVSLASVAIGRSASLGHDLGKAKIAVTKIFQLIDRKSQIDPSSEQGIRPVGFDGSVQLKDVRFTYPSRPGIEVLRGLNLKVASGQTMALVGASGCGKTTVMALIERFYDLKAGSLMMGGYSCKHLNLQWVRHQLGLVSQEPVLFNMSIRYNIEYGDNTRDLSMSEVIEAARMANIHSFVKRLPQGYDTLVGDKGIQLSGGQKQRIAIARALIRNPRILLLDEATSALDAESEQLVQTALDTAARGRTCIVIAHRLSTVQDADCIVVVRNGTVVEQGSHGELMAKCGVYYSLHKAQGQRKR